MNKERLIKSSDRVKSLGEVFTPKKYSKTNVRSARSYGKS